MATLALAGAMAIVGCGGQDPALNGTWYDGGFEFTFSNGNWESRWFDGPERRGTYTARAGAIDMATTHVYQDGWITAAEMMAERESAGRAIAEPGEEIVDALSGTYSVSDGVLTLSLGAARFVLSRR